jgi:hypothetical protein
MSRLKLNEDVDVTIRPEILAQDRAKQGQLTDMMPLAKIAHGVIGDIKR